MKPTAKVTLLGLAALTLTTTACAPVMAQSRPAVAHSDLQIQAALDPYGSWMVLPNIGRVWRPRGVVAGWTPYTEGRWVYVDDEWTWQSDFAWGWAAFHYGRWYRHVQHGWVWVPGSIWAPAWVAWRVGGPWYGWAPLAPAGYGINDRAWCFVSARDFGRRRGRTAFVRGPRLARNGVTRASPAPPRRAAATRAAPAARRTRTLPARSAKPARRASPAPKRTVRTKPVNTTQARPAPKRVKARPSQGPARRVKSAPAKPSKRPRARQRRYRKRIDR